MKSENRVDWEESLLKLLILKGNGGNVHLRVKCNKKAPFSIKTCFIINHFYKTDSTLAFQLIKLQILQTKKATFWLNLMNCCEHTSKLERFRKAIFNLQLISLKMYTWLRFLSFNYFRASFNNKYFDLTKSILTIFSFLRLFLFR